MQENTIKLLHLSDLHFSQGKDKTSTSHKHSIKHLQSIQRFVQNNDSFDRVIISGDLSNYGDRESLLTAANWIFGNIQIGEGETTGLGVDSNLIKVIPGNHDAFNNTKMGPLANRKQKSLNNYNYVFKGFEMQDPYYSYYDWIEKDEICMFLAFVDSCHLGDTEVEKIDSTCRMFDKIAKGKITIGQSEKLLEWFDKGSKGLLQYPNNKESIIPKEKFSTALKILVMHHYIFEPSDDPNDFFMSLNHRDLAFRNIAMADFDILLCGHKHLHDFQVKSFEELFDNKAYYRLILNYFRRLIGIHSLPVQYVDEKGRFLSKLTSLFLNFGFLSIKSKNKFKQEINEKDLLEFLNDFLDKPESIEPALKKYILNYQFKGEIPITRHEIKEIQKYINVNLTIEKRKEFKTIVKEFNRVIKDFKNRPFLQIMSGSSSKVMGLSSRKRSFNDYTISRDHNGYRIESHRHFWVDSSSDFSDEGLYQEQAFKSSSKKSSINSKKTGNYTVSKLFVTIDHT